MSLPDLPLTILDGRETRKRDPWQVDVERELSILLQHLEEAINLFLCGIAAENSSIIHWRKVRQILDLRATPKKFARREPTPINVGDLPSIQLLTTGKATFIDLTKALESLLDFLENVRERRAEALAAPEYFPSLEEDFAERMKTLSLEILSALQELFELQSEQISLIFLATRFDTIRPIELFVTILFLYMDGLIDLVVVEQGGEVDDIIIQPYQ